MDLAGAAVAQNLDGLEADPQVLADAFPVHNVGHGAHFDFAVGRFIRDAQQRAVGHAKAEPVRRYRRRFHVDGNGAGLVEAAEQLIVAQFPIPVVGAGHGARAHARLEIITVQAGNLSHGLLQGNLDFRQRRDRSPKRKILIQDTILAHIGVRQYIVAQLLAATQTGTVADHQPGVGPQDGDVVGTICNAGRLATVGEYGTALGVIKTAHEQGKEISVIALETRPVLQGARLTAFELQQDGIPVRVITDGAAGYAFSRGLLDKFICGADRVVVSSGGHIFNKVGTHTVSVLADYYDVPFYVAAPMSTFDVESELDDVVIEERAPEEITVIGGRRYVPEGVAVLNPAFDVTPPELIDAIITEKGLIYPPIRDKTLFAT